MAYASDGYHVPAAVKGKLDLATYNFHDACFVQDLKELSIDDILSRQLKQMEREKQGQINTLKKQERKVHYCTH